MTHIALRSDVGLSLPLPGKRAVLYEVINKGEKL